MIFKNIIRIISIYKLYLFPVFFFEIFYLIMGYKGNKFSFSDNNIMTDNIPCPYLFLIKIKKTLEKENFNKLVDFGCGSGRVIDFFSKEFKDKEYMGIEYFIEQFNYCKNNFKNKSNIEIIREDFRKIDLDKINADCYFFNSPLKNEEETLEFVNTTLNKKLGKQILLIFINFQHEIIQKLKDNSKFNNINSFKINKSLGFDVFKVN